LSDDPRRNLATIVVSQLHHGANRQITSQLHSRSVCTAAPCWLRLVARAGMVNEHFRRSSPDNPTETLRPTR
jgi:hypothetical protein